MTIKTALCVHGCVCTPLMSNLIAGTKASGAYSSLVQQNMWFVFCMHVDTSTIFIASLIKAPVQQIWPNNKRISPQDIWNILLKVTKILLLHHSSGDYDSFKLSSSMSSLMGDLDDQDDITEKSACAMTHDMCTEVLEGGKNLEDICFRCSMFGTG